MHEVGAAAAVGLARELGHVDLLDRALLERLAQDRLARRLVGREHQHGAVEPARSPQRGVHVPRVVGRRQDEHALVVVLGAVELRQQLVDDVAPAVMAQVAALLAERVELVEEQHARSGSACRLEGVVKFAL